MPPCRGTAILKGTDPQGPPRLYKSVRDRSEIPQRKGRRRPFREELERRARPPPKAGVRPKKKDAPALKSSGSGGGRILWY
jgi:hypothetical protein